MTQAGDSERIAPSAAEVEARELDLQAGLDDLGTLVAGSVPLQTLLDQVAGFAAQAVPAADGVGISMVRLGRDDTRVQALAASADFVSELDAIQYELTDEGPCITAARQREVVRTGNISADGRWPRFGPRVGRLGVHSVLSLPMLLPDRLVVGAINTYAHARDAFDDHAIEIGMLFAGPAGLAVHNAQVLAQAQARAEQLQQALVSRGVIDQAIGILRSRSGATMDEAFARLRQISQSENVKLSSVATRIVEEAVRRARARHAED